ncbi:MAG: AraC family transcriptional regulator N-terminal domain-containing protein [Gammaproteobacteria bacterium]
MSLQIPQVIYTLPPSVCLIGQGQKKVLLGESSFIYDANSFLITSLNLPIISQIISATQINHI